MRYLFVKSFQDNIYNKSIGFKMCCLPQAIGIFFTLSQITDFLVELVHIDTMELVSSMHLEHVVCSR